MKVNFLLIICFFVFNSLSTAQKEDKKNIFSFNAGISIPYSEFAIKEFMFDAGFANLGENIEFDYSRHFNRFFGINVCLGYANINFDKENYKKAYNQLLNQTDGIKVDAGNYEIYKGALGLIIKTPIIHHIEILIMPQLGYSYCIHPALKVTDNEFGVINTIEKNGSWSLQSSMGIKANYHLSDKYGISLNYNRNRTGPFFHDNTSSIHEYFYLPITYQNFNLGFIYKF